MLESANFDGISVRKTSSRLGLRTDASMRYEKILDPELTVTAIKRFVYLLKNIDSGAYVSSDLTDEYVRKYDSVVITFDKKFVDRYTGIDISEERIEKTLTLLGFGVKEEDSTFTVSVPTWRATKDVTIKADIIEEITRIYGYDNFDIATTRSLLRPVRRTVSKDEDGSIKNILVQRFGLHEVHSYIWCDGKKYKKLGIDVEDNVRILNIPTPENGTLRNSMLPTMLTFVYENKGFSDSYGIFEIGRVIKGRRENGECNERRTLGLALCSKTASEKELYFRAVAMIRTIAAEIKHSVPEFTKTAPVHAWQHPTNTSAVSFGGKNVGVICTLHPQNLKLLDRNASVVCVELDLDDFYAVPVGELSYTEPSKFPSIDFDLSVILPEGVRFSEAENAWKSAGCAELASVRVIDVYDLEALKSVTVRLTFSSDERTLSMEEVQAAVDKIVANLRTLGIVLRT